MRISGRKVPRYRTRRVDSTENVTFGMMLVREERGGGRNCGDASVTNGDDCGRPPAPIAGAAPSGRLRTVTAVDAWPWVTAPTASVVLGKPSEASLVPFPLPSCEARILANCRGLIMCRGALPRREVSSVPGGSEPGEGSPAMPMWSSGDRGGSPRLLRGPWEDICWGHAVDAIWVLLL